MQGSASTRYLLALVAALEVQVLEAVRAAAAGPDDGGDDGALEQARALRQAAEDDADDAEARGEPVALRAVQRVFDLDPLQVTALVAAAAPDLDRRFCDLYAYLAEDTAARSVTTALLLRWAGVPAWDHAARRALGPGSVLVDEGLLDGEAQGPVLLRRWTVPPAVLDVLLGVPAVDPVLRQVLVEVPPLEGDDAVRVRRALDAGARLVYLRERSGGLAPARAVAALTTTTGPPLVVDAALLRPDDDLTALVRTALRDAQLAGLALVLGPVDDVVERVVPALRLVARSGWPVVLHGTQPWDPAWTVQVPVEVDVADGGADGRQDLWVHALRGHEDAARLAADVAHLRLGAVQVVRAVDAAAGAAALDGSPLTSAHLVHGARRQNGTGLERLARRVQPVATADDLVLPEEPRALLEDLVQRVRHRDALQRHGVGGRSSSRRGVTALFGGPPGTGKTLAAEVLAGRLGADLYAVDLSTVVDKYVGETEKNLERIFTQAAGVHGVLFFDEADALFGRRGQVTEAKDRHANLGVAYLLQRLEDFDGVAVLASNLRSNLDEAFVRRLDVVVDFPLPDVAARVRLWETCLGASLPRDPDLDLQACAQRFDLSGGEIRNVAVSAAYRALAAGRPLRTDDLLDAVRREYRKLGRLVDPAPAG